MQPLKSSLLHRLAQLVLLLITWWGISKPQPAGAKPWVFFDLGEVILTGSPVKGYRYLNGANRWLRELKAQGYQLGLITNTPGAWSDTCQGQYEALREFIASRLVHPEPFPWQLFDLVVLPPSDPYRKPHPFMFVNGLEHICQEKVLFMGEDLQEVNMAAQLGLATLRVTTKPRWPKNKELAAAFAAFHYTYPEKCAFKKVYEEILAPITEHSMPLPCKVVPKFERPAATRQPRFEKK